MSDPPEPGIERLVQAAALKGVVLDIWPLPGWASGPELVAAAVHTEVGQVVNAMMFVADHGAAGLALIVYLASGRNSVDPRLLAAVAGEVSLRAATAAEVLALTGHPADQVPPFGFGRAVRTLMDGDLRGYEWVWAPAGDPGAVFRMGPRTLMALSSAAIVPVSLAHPPARLTARIGPRRASEGRTSRQNLRAPVLVGSEALIPSPV